MRNKLIVAGLLTAGAVAWAAKDPVVMTVDGVDVPQSEFEYLYNKNSQQQLSPQPLDEYVEMFKLYKLKVADARHDGIDTTTSFIKEMSQYQHDLAAPYLTDSVYLKKLVKEAYDRSLEEVEARHIMLMKSRDHAQNEIARHKLDSLRKELLNGADFETVAKENSQDRTVARNGGYLGYICTGQFPYNFEKEVFTTPEGAISEVFESPVAYHIVKGGKHRKARGTVLASHIMKMIPPTASPEVAAKAKEQIDSIYNVLLEDPAQFEMLAITQSDDKNSGRQGGLLPWFGAGEMVVEFDSAAFALNKGEISEPVRSPYGWHIIKKINEKGVPSYDEMRNAQITRMTNPQDERYALIKANQTARLAKKHHLKENSNTLRSLTEMAGNGIDSTFFLYWQEGSRPETELYTIDGKKINVGRFISKMMNVNQPDGGAAVKLLGSYLDNFLNSELVAAEEEALKVTEPDYAHLLKEYEDGSLLYEVSRNKIWDKAAKDKEGLEKYFESHRSDYAWQEPRVKGILVQTTGDSISALVKSRLPEIGNDSIIIKIRKEFGSNVQIERILVQEGTNPMIDYLMFGGKEVQPTNSQFKDFFIYDARILNAPEEVADVRGLVTSDYQNEFQTIWEEDLKTRYPVEINEKVIKKLRKKYK